MGQTIQDDPHQTIQPPPSSSVTIEWAVSEVWSVLSLPVSFCSSMVSATLEVLFVTFILCLDSFL